GLTRLKSFWYGQLSGIVEPISAVFGATAVLTVQPILPYALAFAAGAMIYVVVEELIPESQQNKNTDLATLGVMGGFTVMMILDVALSQVCGHLIKRRAEFPHFLRFYRTLLYLVWPSILAT